MYVWYVATAGRLCVGTGLYIFSVARERDSEICAGRVCAGTGFHMYHGTVGFLASFDCCASVWCTRGLDTPLEPQSRFGDKQLKSQIVCPQNGTAVL